MNDQVEPASPSIPLKIREKIRHSLIYISLAKMSTNSLQLDAK
jgi:hypothetical protein